MALPQEKSCAKDDYYNLPEGVRAELIDNQIYMLASPGRTHQHISGELLYLITGHIKSNKGKCEVYSAPFDVFLNGDESECFIPDISVICNPDIITERGCHGAPDWIIEITSPSTASRDYFLKSSKYQAAGVKEYWIVNPSKKTVTVYNFNESEFSPITYTFNDKIKVNIYDDFRIDFDRLDI